MPSEVPMGEIKAEDQIVAYGSSVPVLNNFKYQPSGAQDQENSEFNERFNNGMNNNCGE